MAQSIEIRGTGTSFAIYTGDTRVSPYFSSRSVAEMAADRLARELRQTTRRCLCCRDAFVSEGPHNRLCNKCRKK